jgi:hypothetical protein
MTTATRPFPSEQLTDGYWTCRGCLLRSSHWVDLSDARCAKSRPSCKLVARSIRRRRISRLRHYTLSLPRITSRHLLAEKAEDQLGNAAIRSLIGHGARRR